MEPATLPTSGVAASHIRSFQLTPSLAGDLREANQLFAKAGLSAKGVWLTRGALRCHLLGDLQPWDDMDFITLAAPSDLEKISLVTYTERNFHGGYRFWLPSGRKADLWSAHLTFGRRCESLKQAAELFEFAIDTFMAEWNEESIIIYDPLNKIRELEQHRLTLQRELSG